jgi:hypothetical protein
MIFLFFFRKIYLFFYLNYFFFFFFFFFEPVASGVRGIFDVSVAKLDLTSLDLIYNVLTSGSPNFIRIEQDGNVTADNCTFSVNGSLSVLTEAFIKIVNGSLYIHSCSFTHIHFTTSSLITCDDQNGVIVRLEITGSNFTEVESRTTAFPAVVRFVNAGAVLFYFYFNIVFFCAIIGFIRHIN